MAKRGYKLQEFLAHSGSVNCVKMGKKTCRLLLTGGDDQKVNLWSIGKPTSLMSLCGHTSPVESVAFDSAEVLVLAGASAGVIKLWDLEEIKMVRTLTGHRSNCTAVEFHPFGEFFASGALDANLKIWDIRKKGCIHTYKGHTRGISTIKFTPDGRWVVSGGFDNIVKVWDLTAGKLLHDFKYHEGHIRSLDFHPLEFLLATGSADRTVKFWDLETFELIGSARPEASSVRSITFHPDGRTLLCGLDDSLKIYSWEPVIGHDALDMGWSTLGDLCIHEEKLLGCSYYQNSVGVWGADISFIEQYRVSGVTDENSSSEKKYDLQESSVEKAGIHRRSGSTLRSTSPDYETKEIKNIYVDTAAENPVASKRIGLISPPKGVVPSDSKESSNLLTLKQGPKASAHAKAFGQKNTKSFIVPSVVPRDSPDGRSRAISRRESITDTRTGTGVPVKPPHVRSLSATKLDTERLSMVFESETMKKLSDSKNTVDSCIHIRTVADNEANETTGEEHLDIKNVTEKFEKVLSPQTPFDHKKYNEHISGTEKQHSVRYVNGVAVVRGRTRSLVERFERSEKLNSDEVHASNVSPDLTSQTTKSSFMLGRQPQIAGSESKCANQDNITEDLMQNHDIFLSTLRGRLTKLQVLRHFWERNDIKGAIEAMKKLPDHSVQADMMSVLKEKMGILTLDLFSCLLPLLLGLLDSKIERHANISLETLLKLVAVFGPVIHSAISAPPAVGVDLHAEQRLQCCNQCFVQLQKIQQVLPALIRRGGLLAKGAHELNLVLQQS